MIVSDTSPLRYLVAVRQVDLIQEVFHEVLISPGVYEELSHRSAPKEVRLWLKQRPPWIEIRELRAEPAQDLLGILDRGEAETIQLALEIQAQFILIDERLGRKTAAALGLTVIGALGLLRESHRQGLLSEPVKVLDQMRLAGFRISQALYRSFQSQIDCMKR